MAPPVAVNVTWAPLPYVLNDIRPPYTMPVICIPATVAGV